MAGVGGALYAAALGTVSPDRFNFFDSLPLLLLAVVGGIGTAGGALFAGIVLYGIPLVVGVDRLVREHRPGAARRSWASGSAGTRTASYRDMAERFVAVAPRHCDPRGHAAGDRAAS